MVPFSTGVEEGEHTSLCMCRCVSEEVHVALVCEHLRLDIEEERGTCSGKPLKMDC